MKQRSHFVQVNHSGEESFYNYLDKVWEGRELIYILVKKDILLKLSRTFFGRLWLLIPTVITIIIYSLFFGQLLNLNTGSSPYPLFLISGLTLWNYFSQSTNLSANTLISNQDLIKKTPFPKLILNISSCIYTLVEQIPLLVILLIFSFIYQRPSFSQIIIAPFVYLLLIFFSLGIGNLLSNISIHKRDIIHAYSFVVQILLWLTPVFYPVTLIPDKYIFIIYLNPITGLLDLFRWSLNIQDISNVHYIYYLYSIFVSLFILLFSIKIYKQNDKTISDYI
ncbi:MAG: ABC transporter permease [Chitinophagales bacterium]|nr:ABC transporter permease [Chitinophagales bacterium]